MYLNHVFHGSGRHWSESFIGIDYGINVDLTNRLPDRWQDFNREFRPIYLADHPDKSKVAAGLATATSATWPTSANPQNH